MSRGGGALEEALDRLYALPVAEFTAARNAAVRERKAAGDDEAAEAVKQLRKPTRSAGAINRAVRGRRDDAKELLAAADDLRSAQERMLAGAGREAVAEAAERERAAIDAFMTAVEAELEAQGGASEAMRERARSTLQALPGDPGLCAEFEAGRLVKDHEAVGFGGLTVAAAPKANAPRSDERREGRRRLKQAERDLEMAERRLQRARSRAATAQEQLAAANAGVAEAEEDVAEATRLREAAAKAAD